MVEILDPAEGQAGVDMDIIQEDEAATATAAGAGDGVVTIPEDEDEDALPKQAVPQDDGSVLLPLSHPVVLKFRRGKDGPVREQRYEQLVLHRLAGADLRAIGAASRESMAVVSLARSARMHTPEMNLLYDRMDGFDAASAAQVVNHFLATGRTTGR